MKIINQRLRTSPQTAKHLIENTWIDGVINCCNVFCNFNTDFGKKIGKILPEMSIKDGETEKGDRTKIGTFTYIRKTKSTLAIKDINFYGINAYTYSDQKNTIFDYEGFEKILTDLNEILRGKLVVFVIPDNAVYTKIVEVMKKSVQLYSVLITKE